MIDCKIVNKNDVENRQLARKNLKDVQPEHRGDIIGVKFGDLSNGHLLELVDRDTGKIIRSLK